jgi:hypothetical protein
VGVNTNARDGLVGKKHVAVSHRCWLWSVANASITASVVSGRSFTPPPSMYPRVEEHAHAEPRWNREGYSSPVVLTGEQETFYASEEAA